MNSLAVVDPQIDSILTSIAKAYWTKEVIKTRLRPTVIREVSSQQ
jgi:hypothetical protein